MGRVLNFPRIPGNQGPEPPEPDQAEDLRDLDLTSLAYQENPAPWLHRIREKEPVFHTRHGYWLLTRYGDVKAALRDPRFSSDWGRLRGVPQGNSRTNANKRLIQSSFNMKDPPEHTRMRSLINLAFAGIAVESRRNRIAELSNQLWQARGPQAEFCLVEDFGFHLPIIVAAEMIGIPIEDRLLFRRLFEDAELLFLSGRTPEQEERGRRALAEQIRYVRALVADRRNYWQDDLISELVRAETQDAPLTEDEIISTVVTIFTAAGTTTERLISSGLLALLQHPEQLAKLRENPARIDGAIEEILRWHHPDQSTSTPRWTTEDVRIGGTTIPRHATVRLSLGAANRDPAQFPAPDTFDIARAPNRHLSFGRGNHFCLGASLARLEAKIAIQTVACADGRLELLTENPHRDPRRPDRYAKILVRVRTGDNPLP